MTQFGLYDDLCTSQTWVRIHKGDHRGRELADDHYTRQTPGAALWTRPGYSFCLLHKSRNVTALWCWWRPKWEHGTPGTERKDGLRVIECTMFRRVGHPDVIPRASELILAAEQALLWPEAQADLHIEAAGGIASLITGVSTKKTGRARAPRFPAGRCYRAAGWVDMDKSSLRADVWLTKPYPRTPPRGRGVVKQ